MKRWMTMWIALALAFAGPVAVGQEASDDQQDAARRPHRPMIERWKAQRAERGEPGERREAPPHPFGPPSILSDEEIHELMPVIEDLMPHMAERLETLRQTHPERFGLFVSHLAGRLREMVELKQHEPDEYHRRVAEAQARLKAMQRVRQYHQARREGNAAQAERIKAELRRMVGAHIDARQKAMERELHQLEQRVEELRAKLKQRAAQREPLIDEHLDTLLTSRLHDAPARHRRKADRADRSHRRSEDSPPSPFRDQPPQEQ